MNVKCPNCNAEILRIVIEGKDVEFENVHQIEYTKEQIKKMARVFGIDYKLDEGPTDSEMLDWLDQSFSIDVAYYTGSDTAKRWWHLKRDPLDKKPLREAIAAAMRESGGE